VATVAVALLVVLAGVTWAAGPAGVADGLPGGTAAPSDAADEPGGEEIPPTGGGRSVDEPTPAESDGEEEDDETVDLAAVRADRGDGDGYPPGLGPAGVASAGRLAASHALSASERSYVWSLTYRETSDGDLRSVRWETVRVERPGQYRTTVTGWGNATAPDTPVSTVETYADGSTRFVRLPDGRVSTYRLGGAREYGSVGLYADRSARLVRRYLEAEPTRVVSSTAVDNRTYHLVYAGEGYDSSTPTTTLTVDERGMVHAFRTRFPVAGSNVTAVVAFEYSRVNATTVAPPDWYAEALVAAVDPEMSGSTANQSGGTGASTPRRTDAPGVENRSADADEGFDDEASRKPVPVPTGTDNASRTVRGDGDVPPPSVEPARGR
jgi:hypothetical protein